MTKFGTSGLRGLAIDLLAGEGARYAIAFAKFLEQNCNIKDGAEIFIGYDRRASSPELTAICAAALAHEGLKPINCGALPTPALALYAMGKSAPCLMVTGSHIPGDRNGLKFYRADGEINKHDEAAIRDCVVETMPSITPLNLPVQDAASHLYMKRYENVFPQHFMQGLKVGVYQHSSVAREMMVDILAHFGAEIVPLAPSETFIPIDTEAVSDALQKDLKSWASTHSLDAIISTDGDADRPFMADEHGVQIRGDALGLISANVLGVKNIVTPVTSNSKLEDPAFGFNVTRTRVGSPFVIEAMEIAKPPMIGFEANGGLMTGFDIILNNQTLTALPTRDALLPILCVLFASTKAQTPLSQIVSKCNLNAASSARIENFASERSAQLMAWLAADSANIAQFIDGLGAVVKVNTIDGVQILLEGDAMVHIRPSGNAPEMRCYAEAPSLSQAKELVEAGLKRIEQFS